MASQQRLTSLVRRFLGVMRVLILIGIVFVPLITLAVGYGALEESDDPDARVFAELRVIADADVVDAERPRINALVKGWTEVRTRNRDPLSWYLFAGISELVLCLTLYGVIQLRALFADLVEGDAFTDENCARVRKVGVAVVCYYAVAPLLQFGAGCLVLANIDLVDTGIQLSPAFNLSIAGLFVGFAMIVLAGILREAVVLREEQQLTI
jgi:hypothetical protein